MHPFLKPLPAPAATASKTWGRDSIAYLIPPVALSVPLQVEECGLEFYSCVYCKFWVARKDPKGQKVLLAHVVDEHVEIRKGYFTYSNYAKPVHFPLAKNYKHFWEFFGTDFTDNRIARLFYKVGDCYTHHYYMVYLTYVKIFHHLENVDLVLCPFCGKCLIDPPGDYIKYHLSTHISLVFGTVANEKGVDKTRYDNDFARWSESCF